MANESNIGGCRYSAISERLVPTAALLLAICIAVISSMLVSCAPSPSAEYNSARRLVVLDDGCPNGRVPSGIKLTCDSTSGAMGGGDHASMILKTLTSVADYVDIPVDELVFINISDADGRSSKHAILEGLQIATKLQPLAVNISYSLTHRDDQIEQLLEDLTTRNTRIFASYSNLFLEEESFPASSIFTVGVKTGETTSAENDNTIIIEKSLVEEFSDERASTSAASIIALALSLACEVEQDANNAVCSAVAQVSQAG